MKKIKILCSVLAVSIFFVFFAFSVGVNGAWHYAMGVSGAIEVPMSVGLFPWEGFEELPDQSDVGENHIALVQRLAVSDYGFNNPSSFLSDYIQDRIANSKDTVSSVAPTPGGNLKDLFNTSEMQKLDFMIHLHLDTYGNILHLELFTFETAVVGNKIGVHVSPVYKTDMTLKDGKWLPLRTYVGSADTMKYDAKQGGTRITINPTSWVEGATSA